MNIFRKAIPVRGSPGGDRIRYFVPGRGWTFPMTPQNPPPTAADVDAGRAVIDTGHGPDSLDRTSDPDYRL
jgi:hypothetical protein